MPFHGDVRRPVPPRRLQPISGLLEGVGRWKGKPLDIVKRADLGAEEMGLHLDLSRFLGAQEVVVRTRDWFNRLASGQAESFAEIARAEGVTRRYVANVIPLAFLAPDIVASILAGTQPVDLTAQKLIKRIDLPLDWAEQRALLGFAP